MSGSLTRSAGHRHSWRDEGGFTVVEGVVACLLVAIGTLAAIGLFDIGTRNAFRAEESQGVVTRLQAELEKIVALPYSQVAMSAAPSPPEPPANQNDPRSRVSGSAFAVAAGGSDEAPMAIDTTNGHVIPGPTPFGNGDVRGRIFRFVVWRDDPACPEANCPGNQDLKQVIVTAVVDSAPASFERAYQEVHTEISDPAAAPVDPEAHDGDGDGVPDAEDACPTVAGPVAGDGCPPGHGPPGVPSQLWLTDTPCSSSIREPIEVLPPTDGHPLHNTRGRCSDGKHQGVTGGTPGAPDLMFTQAPPLEAGIDPDDLQPQYDFATELERPDDSPLEKGLQIRPQSGLANAGCLLASTGGLLDMQLPSEEARERKMHKWLSPSIPDSGGLVLTGTASLSLWTQTTTGQPEPGKICAWLFVRSTATGFPVDTPLVNIGDPSHPTFFQKALSEWPPTWDEVTLKMKFAAVSLSPGDRLGLAITVDRGGTPNPRGLEFHYDHPNFDSRLEVITQNPLPF